MLGSLHPTEQRKYLTSLQSLLKRSRELSDDCFGIMTHTDWYLKNNRIGNTIDRVLSTLRDLKIDAYYNGALLWDNEHELNLNGGRTLLHSHAQEIARLAQDDDEDGGNTEADDVSNHVPLSYSVMMTLCEASYVVCFLSTLDAIASVNDIKSDESVDNFYERMVATAITAVDEGIDVEALGFGWDLFAKEGIVLSESLVSGPGGKSILPLHKMSEINHAVHYLRTVWRLLHTERIHIEALEEILFVALGRLIFKGDSSCLDLFDVYVISSAPAAPLRDAQTLPDAERNAPIDPRAPQPPPELSISPAFFADLFIIFHSFHVQRHSVLQDIAEVSKDGIIYKASANGEKTLVYTPIRMRTIATAQDGRAHYTPDRMPDASVSGARNVFDPLLFALHVCDRPPSQQGDTDRVPETQRNTPNHVLGLADGKFHGISIAVARMMIPVSESILKWARQYNAEIEGAGDSYVIRHVTTRADALHLLPADSKLASCWEPGGDTRPTDVLHWRLGQQFINNIADRVRGGPGHLLQSEHPNTNPLAASVLMTLLSHAHQNVCAGARSVPLEKLCLIWMETVEEQDGDTMNLTVPALVQLHGVWCVALAGFRTHSMGFMDALQHWLAACYYLEETKAAMFPIKTLLVSMKRVLFKCNG
jgi:hypothetical protein